jgi:hypothetical protein
MFIGKVYNVSEVPLLPARNFLCKVCSGSAYVRLLVPCRVLIAELRVAVTSPHEAWNDLRVIAVQNDRRLNHSLARNLVACTNSTAALYRASSHFGLYHDIRICW